MTETFSSKHSITNKNLILNSSVINKKKNIKSTETKLYPNKLVDRERQKLLFEWNDTQVDYPQAVCIHKLFEAQVAKTPEAVAVVFENQKLSYRQLNIRANQLAHYLRKLGVKPEVVVGIYLERSLETIVALLGILKAGGAYLPLDPKYPPERLTYMLKDAQASVLLTQQQLVKHLPSCQANFIYLDRDWQNIANEASHNLNNEVKPENLVYVVYTSGSTGLPKGVALEHRQLFNYLNSISSILNLPTGANYATVSTIAADLGNTVIFPSLCHGGCLHVISAELVTNPQALGEYFQRNSIDCLKIVPSHLRALLTSKNNRRILPRQRLVLGGEASNWELIEQIQQLAPNCQVINHYGPTEATVGALTYSVKSVPIVRESRTVPIGRPIANTNVYILDANKQLVPIGTTGELYIGGDGLARGYLNRPELTAEKFVSNPFSQDVEAKLYKTGDLVRYLKDGSIEFIGRVDNQIKIRGFRVELGEIEAKLLEYPDIQSSVVLAREEQEQSGDRKLVAYLVFNPKQAATVNQLRQFLKQKLPDYMVPSAFIFLDSLPLTPNGKLDIRALPAPEKRKHLEDFVGARNELEFQLTQIWERVLDIQPISVKDNFFDFGGDSLLAVRLFTEIENSLKQKLPLVSLLQAATIEQLAKIIDRSQEKSKLWRSLVPIRSEGSKKPLFLVHARGASILLYRNLATYLDPDRPIYGLQPKGLDGKQEPLTSVEAMAAHYIQEIKTIQPEGDYLLGGYSFGGKLAFEMAQQFHRQGDQVSLLALLDCWGPSFYKRQPLQQRILIHLRNLAQDKHLYLQNKIQGWYQWLTEELQYSIHRISLKFFQQTKLPLPLVLRNQYVEDINLQAAANYQPSPYPGKIVLLRALEWLGGVGCEIDRTLGWEQFAQQGIDIHEVPGDHYSIFAPENAPTLAKQLELCIEQAETDELRSS